MATVDEYLDLHIKRLRLEPGDTIVFQLTDDFMSRKDFEQFSDNAKKAMAEKCPGHECIVLSAGVELSTIKPDATP